MQSPIALLANRWVLTPLADTKRKRMTLRFRQDGCYGIVLLLIMIIPFTTGCREPLHKAAGNVSEIPENDYLDMYPLDRWRVTGPFVLSTDDNHFYSREREQQAFDTDYLSKLQGDESRFLMPEHSSAITVDFTRNSRDDVAPLPAKEDFFNQNINLPRGLFSSKQLYWGFPRRFGVTYAATHILCKSESDVVLIISGNSPLKVWLNERVIAVPSPGLTGHNWSDEYVQLAHLHAGRNNLLLKMFTFPGRNDFTVRMGSREEANRFLENNATYIDLAQQLILPVGGRLPLSPNLAWLMHDAQLGHADVYSQRGHLVMAVTWTKDVPISIDTSSLTEGLYDLKITMGPFTQTQLFFIGNPRHISDQLDGRCALKDEVMEKVGLCEMNAHLRDIIPSSLSQDRLDKDKYIILLLSQLVWQFEGINEGQRLFLKKRQIWLQHYHTHNDADNQFYYIYLPSTYKSNRTVKLVVVCPYDHHDKSFFDKIPASQALTLSQYAAFAERYGFAFIFPSERGLGMDAEGGMSGVIGAIDDATARFKLDPKFYATGDCAGGKGALLLAESMPQRVRAISTLNASTGLAQSRVGDGLFRGLGVLRDIPLQLVHGDLFPHSPLEQAYVLRKSLAEQGVSSELIKVPGDATFGPEDPISIAFRFFARNQHLR